MFIGQWIRKFNCYFGLHETYSQAGDLNFKFTKEMFQDKTTDDLVAQFDEITTLRCRHCDWTYKGLKLNEK